MSTGQTILLGAIAGLTIFVGLPMGRMRRGSRSTRTFLSGVSAGILVFLLFDILENATHPVEEALRGHEWARLATFSTVYLAGLGVGMLGLLYVGRAWRRARPAASLGPGAMAVAEADLHSDALRVGMSIATGIGLHNFSEGLAIGQ
ncbi:MAG: ZIP family metal transporter, partial [Actinomycetota bacterium]